MPELSLDEVAWIHLDADGRVLTARNAGLDLFYVPGGHREPGESDVDTLVREVPEEPTAHVDPASVEYVGTFEEPRADRHRVSTIDQLVLDALAATGRLRRR